MRKRIPHRTVLLCALLGALLFLPADPKDTTVQFREDGTLQAKADCNLKGGKYSSAGKPKS